MAPAIDPSISSKQRKHPSTKPRSLRSRSPSSKDNPLSSPSHASGVMSLYLDAAAALAAPAAGGSFKARVYSSRLRASPAQVVALVGEASKWDVVLKEVIENADLLRQEPKVCRLFFPFLCSTMSTY